MTMKRRMTIAVLLLTALCGQGQTTELATETVRNMKVGWNLGNTLDACNGKRVTDVTVSETMWGQPVTRPELMQMMQEAGFGAIRVPVTWYPHIDDHNRVDAQWMQRVHEVVDYVLQTGMYCILNVHHDTGAGDNWLHANMSIYDEQKSHFEQLWQQIAEEFKDYGERLLFESYNEMLDKYDSWCFATFARPNGYNATDATDAYNAINSYAQSFVNTVRATGGNNSQRNLVVNTYGACCGEGNWNAHLQDPLKQMKLPTDTSEGHLIFQVHCYPNIENLTTTKNSVSQMFKYLNTYLAAKGAPVIIGEWGSSSGDDYMNRHDNLVKFIDYFVQQAKANNFATFYWMGISDGSTRTLPAFSQPDLARAILQAYYGNTYSPTLPTVDDYDITYTVSYNGQWQELNLCSDEVSLDNYKAIRVELGETPKSGTLSVKMYGEADGKEQYTAVTQQSQTVNFNRSNLGGKTRRITLQYSKSEPYTISVKHAYLVRSDGTLMEMRVSPFWGCTVETKATKKSTPVRQTTMDDTPGDSCLYTLSGLRMTKAGKRGIYISNNKKIIIK